jgi:Tfp pilus assembly protein PilX
MKQEIRDKRQKNLQKGFAAIYITTLVLAIVFAVAVSAYIIAYSEQQISKNIVSSGQAYYASEAGIEDALLRVVQAMDLPSSYTLNVGDSTAQIEVSDLIGGTKTITSNGNDSNRLRKTQALYIISAEEINFYYGAQVGDGGMTMDNNSRVAGNIYSNGSVIASGRGYIDNTIVVASNGNRIEGLQVGEDAMAHTCVDSDIAGELTYVSGGSLLNCTAGSTIKERPNEIEPADMPISQSQIDQWKSDAESGGIIPTDYVILSSYEDLGAIKIDGDLLIDNNATLNMRGTIWVTGDLRIDNGSTVQLDSNAYGITSGVLVVDGKIKVKPNTILKGSGQPSSYIMLLSTNSELVDFANPALEIDNNTDAAIFYASQGLVVLRNNVQAREVTGYKVHLDNNAEIIYESGLQNSAFSSGTGGGWEVSSWREID